MFTCTCRSSHTPALVLPPPVPFKQCLVGAFHSSYGVGTSGCAHMTLHSMHPTSLHQCMYSVNAHTLTCIHEHARSPAHAHTCHGHIGHACPPTADRPRMLTRVPLIGWMRGSCWPSCASCTTRPFCQVHVWCLLFFCCCVCLVDGAFFLRLCVFVQRCILFCRDVGLLGSY